MEVMSPQQQTIASNHLSTASNLLLDINDVSHITDYAFDIKIKHLDTLNLEYLYQIIS